MTGAFLIVKLFFGWKCLGCDWSRFNLQYGEKLRLKDDLGMAVIKQRMICYGVSSQGMSSHIMNN